MKIENSTALDIDEIFRLYDIATALQKQKSSVYWPQFDRAMVEDEIAENRQWKAVQNDRVACVWATAFSDPQIWEEKDNDPAVYIHRIATSPDFRGQNMVGNIVQWARDYAAQNDRRLIRMDTVGDNPGLIAYYRTCGFNFLGLSKLKNTVGLPAHYDNATVSLFEMKV